MHCDPCIFDEIVIFNTIFDRATNRLDSAGLGSERPDGISRDDDEFDAYRKRMMLAYRFRPNPLVSRKLIR